MRNQNWTFDDLKLLCIGLSENYSFKDLADMLNRSESAIVNQQYRLIHKQLKSKFAKKLYLTTEYKKFIESIQSEPKVLVKKISPEVKVIESDNNSVKEFKPIKKSIEKEYFLLQLVTAGVFTLLGFIVGKFI